jgi:glycosyltransferase involved in cell wall biosynthesis
MNTAAALEKDKPKKITRVAVLWAHVTGYLQAALRALLADEAVRLLVIQNAREINARFNTFSHERCDFIGIAEQSPEATNWMDRLQAFAPEVAIITGNPYPRYLQAARILHEQGTITVWANDRILRVPMRDAYQMALGRIGRRWRFYDAAFVPGYAATQYARSIGFPEALISQGLYTCDTALYHPVGLARHSDVQNTAWPRVFLFLGQFIERKGVDILIRAYQRYREVCSTPCELWCAGAGPLEHLFTAQEGVKLLGFLSPQACAEVMGQVGALVLPSRWDHWGVVIHEATCAGLPVITTNRCYAAIELVQTGYNGYVVDVGNVPDLTHALLSCSEPARAQEMGKNSLRLSYRFTPELFAWQVLENIPPMVRAAL